jgi:hypothetical protein
MRSLARVLALVGLAALLSAQTLDTAVRSEVTDCASGGSAAGTLTAGETYLMRVTDADTFVCFAASASTCAANGEKFPQGTIIRMTANGNQVSWSCRSSGSNGDVIFTKFK